MEYTNALGRRKSAVARIYVAKGKGNITVNNREVHAYFTVPQHLSEALKPLQLTSNSENFDIKVNLKGGGIHGQAEALKLALARAMIKIDPELRPLLKANGLLTRDAREVERKKPGRPKARKRFQFSKR